MCLELRSSTLGRQHDAGASSATSQHSTLPVVQPTSIEAAKKQSLGLLVIILFYVTFFW